MHGTLVGVFLLGLSILFLPLGPLRPIAWTFVPWTFVAALLPNWDEDAYFYDLFFCLAGQVMIYGGIVALALERPKTERNTVLLWLGAVHMVAIFARMLVIRRFY